MDIPSIVSVAQTLTPVGTLLLLIAIALERAIDRGWIRFGRVDMVSENGKINNLSNLMNEVLNGQKKLNGHFNDETTHLLTEIDLKLDELKEIREGQRVGFTLMAQKFNEYDKFGIPMRPK